MQSKTIKIDPKFFLSNPFTSCPKCKKPDFGVLMVNPYSYVRRCASCKHDQSYKLPRLSRKVIYIDQFAISDMMKSINPQVGKENKVDPFFKALFEKLDRLNKLQLIICPDSNNHFNESIVSPYYSFLKRMYEQLSHGTTLYDSETIKRFQITENFREWVGDAKKPLDIGDMLMGDNLDGWQSRLIISVSLRDQDPALPQELRRERDETSDALTKVFERWQTESAKSFNDWYEEERASFGQSIIKNYMSTLIDYVDFASGQNTVDINSFSSLLSQTSVTFTIIHRKLKEKGFSDNEVFKKSIEFFNSEKVKEIPYLRLSAILFAGLAKEASLGRKKPPTKGMFNDVEVLAAYSPYCDALFVDNECKRLLSSRDAKSKLDVSSKIFSQDNKEDFLTFLDEIEKTATKKHIELVKQVYGEGWESPFVTMFDKPAS